MTETNYKELIEQLDAAARLVEVRPFPGSFSNETTLLTLETAVGHQQIVVRRCAVFGDYDRGEKAEREFKTLALLQNHGIPAPPTAAARQKRRSARHSRHRHQLCAGPANHPDGRSAWQAVHNLLPAIQPVPPALMHIDYWLGNILWQAGQITAVLDWEEASYGDPGYDVAYLRLELAMLGGEPLADAFLAAYEAEYGRSVANLAFWELVAAARRHDWRVAGVAGRRV